MFSNYFISFCFYNSTVYDDKEHWCTYEEEVLYQTKVNVTTYEIVVRNSVTIYHLSSFIGFSSFHLIG